MNKLSSEIFFWLHILIIVFALTMGLFFPLWIVVAAAMMHRVHTWVFDGCVFSKLERNMGSFDGNTDFLRHAAKKLFNKTITASQSKQIDYVMLVSSLLIALSSHAVRSNWVGPIELSLILSSILGLIVSIFIAYRESAKNSFKCDSKNTCQIVLRSQYNQIGGVKLYTLGIIFYSLVLLTLICVPLTPVLSLPILILGSIGIAVSSFLIILQATALRSWCKWCLSSAFATFGIFISAINLPY